MKRIYYFIVLAMLYCSLSGSISIRVVDDPEKDVTIQQKVDELEFFKSGNIDFFINGVRHIHANILTLNLVSSGTNLIGKNKTNWFYNTERNESNELSNKIESRNFISLSIDSGVYDYSDKQNYYPSYDGADLASREQEKLLVSILDPAGGLLSINLGYEFKIGPLIFVRDDKGEKKPRIDKEENLTKDQRGKAVYEKERKKRLLLFKLVNRFGVKLINGTRVSDEKEYNGISAYGILGFHRDLGIYDLLQKKGGTGWIQAGGFCSLNQKAIMTDIFGENARQNLLGLYSEIGMRIEGLVFLKFALYQCLNNDEVGRLRKPAIRITLQMFNKSDTEEIPNQ